MEGHELGTSAAYRRLVQCVWHGLLSHAYEDRTPGKAARAQPTLPAFTLPVEPFRRFRYLYLFVFRHCIENAPEWTLSRGFVRSELRFLIAGMFANPRWGVEVLARLHAMTEVQRRLRHARDLRLSLSYGRLLGTASSGWILRESALQTDILEALARSAFDTGRLGFARRLAHFVQNQRRTSESLPAASASHATNLGASGSAVVDSLQSQLTRIAVAINGLHDYIGEASTRIPPGLRHDPVDHAFEKILIDSRLARSQYSTARSMCLRWLTNHGLDCSEYQSLGTRYPQLGEPPPGQTAKALFESRVLMPLVERVWGAATNTRDRVVVADMVSRLGQCIAGLADETPDSADQSKAFVSAYALFWIADRVRSAASGVDDGLNWPRVSSRAMQNFILVSLDCARIHADGAEPGSARHQDGLAYYSQARRRMDVYASHLFRLPRERLAMLLLMASAARVWADNLAPPTQQLADLKASLGYLDQAKAVLFRLGYPDMLAYPFLFERATIYRRLAALEPASISVVKELFERDRDALSIMAAGDPLWRRRAARLKDAESRAAEPAPRVEWFATMISGDSRPEDQQ
jgi:hypothetical protein